MMQHALGDDWDHLPPALQAHYSFRDGVTVSAGYLDIDFPRGMKPVLYFLGWFGVLVHRRGRGVETRVEKHLVGKQQFWHRTLRFADGQTFRFDTFWEAAANGHVVEYVNPILGLEMAVFVADRQLHYRSIRFIARFGSARLPIPLWLLLGNASIIEQAIDERRFSTDFRLTHPWFGELFRYAGTFEAEALTSSTD